MNRNVLSHYRAGRLDDHGFTLLELLVVLVILGLLAALAGPRVLNQLSGARSDAARVQIESLATALEFYLLDNQSYPESSEGLGALISRPAGADGWNGPYIDAPEIPKDPWGNDYIYQGPADDSGTYDLFSLGSNGVAGGEGSATDIRKHGN